MAKKKKSKSSAVPATGRLYAEESIVIALEAAKTAGQHIIQKNFDVHFRDACLKVGLEANALISGHEDAIEELPMFDLPEDDKKAGQAILDQCEECENALPKGGDLDTAALDPETLLMLFKLFSSVWNYFRRKDQLAPQD